MIPLDSWKTWFRMKAFLPDLHISKWLLDSAHDTMPYYIYCRKNHIQPFIDLNVKRGIKIKYKNDFTIHEDGVPICKAERKCVMTARNLMISRNPE